jgi:hypothetical protein
MMKQCTVLGLLVGASVGLVIVGAEILRPQTSKPRETRLETLKMNEQGVASSNLYFDLLISRAKGVRLFKKQSIAGITTDYSFQGDYHFGDYQFGDYSFNDGSYDNGSGVYESINPYAKKTLIQPLTTAAN